MNWGKILIGGVVGGIAMWLYDFLVHGVIMSGTYASLVPQVFSDPEGGNPLSFGLVSLAVGVGMAMLFAKTRSSWGAGVKGGATFGLFLGVATFFTQMYQPLVIEGFPYYLAWCWGTINLIGGMVFGVAASFFIKE